jgi:hypothetical protein
MIKIINSLNTNNLGCLYGGEGFIYNRILCAAIYRLIKPGIYLVISLEKDFKTSIKINCKKVALYDKYLVK